MLISVMEKDESLALQFSNEDQNFLEGPLNGKPKEIDIKEIKLQGAVGKGSFGVVYKAIWRDFIVAVKKAETDIEVAALEIEIKQLSRIQHENIIHMYGVASSMASKCLVMEFADGGSLYDFLHCPPFLKYNISHALGWLLQCAKAMDYLHSFQPKPIIHRDLKPLNMLLTNGRKLLKVCDFGTACVLRSTMTDNRGSIAWMAPEVMKGQNYDQKCDVYSWGMILWEVLTRRIPFEEWGLPIRIIWQVINHKRPPPIQGCPRPLENLITSCWSETHSSRPSMQRVLEVLIPLYRVLSGVDEPITYSSSSSGGSYTESFMSPGNDESSGGHTSRDVSELPSTSNTMDLSYSQQSCTPSSTPSSSTPTHPISNENTLDDSSDCMSKHSTPGSASSKIPVMKPISPKLWWEGTNFHPSPFCQFAEAKAKLDKKGWPPPPLVPSKGPSITPTPSSECVQEPMTMGDSSFFTPLIITIPNREPLERKDVVIAPTCKNYSKEALSPYSRGLPLMEVPPSTVKSSHQVMPNTPSMSCASPCLGSNLSPHSSCARVPRSIACSSHTPLSPQHGAISQLRHEFGIPSSINITSATPNASTDSLDFASSPPRSQGISHPVDILSVSTPLIRRHLAANPLASVRRRSAEVSDSCSRVKIEGHKRSSSYGSASLIGFEPLVNEVSQNIQGVTSGMQTLSPFHAPNSVGGKAPLPFSVCDQRAALDTGDIPSGRESSLHCVAKSTPSGFSHAHPNAKVSSISSHTSAHYPANHPEGNGIGVGKDGLGAFWEWLDNDLKPLMPLTNVPLSQQVFQQHKELAHQFLVAQDNMVYLGKTKNDLSSQLNKQEKNHKSCQQRYNEKIIQLQNKNEGLRRDHLRLSQQLADIKRKRQASQHQHRDTQQQASQPQPQTQVSPRTHQQQHQIVNPSLHPYQQHPQFYRHNAPQNPPFQQHHSSHLHGHHICCDPHCQHPPSHPHQTRPHLHPQHSMYPNLQNQ